MNRTIAIGFIKNISKHLIWYRKVVFLVGIFQFLWLIVPKKTVRTVPHITRSPWIELSGALFIPGIFNSSRLYLQKIDLRSGALQRKIFKGNGQGHSVLFGKTGKGWLLPENGFSIIEFDSQTLRQTNTITSNGNLIGGHGALSPDGNSLYFVDRGVHDETLDSNLVIYDLDRREIIYKYERIGIYPHDVKIADNGQSAIIASYGRIADFVGGGKNLNYSEKNKRLHMPSFTIVDLQRQTIKTKCTFDETFMLAHVALDEDGKAAFIHGTDYLLFSQISRQSLSSILQQRKAPLSLEEILKGMVFTPGVQLKVDLQNAKVVKRLDYCFCRPQSIVLSKRTGMIFETFGINNRVVLYNKETLGIEKEFDFSALGNVDPRGLAFSVDERFLLVSGREKNIYCLDLYGKNKLGSQVIYSKNNSNSHITFFEG